VSKTSKNNNNFLNKKDASNLDINEKNNKTKSLLAKKDRTDKINDLKPILVINKDGNIGFKGALVNKGVERAGILGNIFSDLHYADIVIRFSNPFFKF
jgi:hypothetical protein